MKHDVESRSGSRSASGIGCVLLLLILVLSLLLPLAACKQEPSKSVGKHPYRKALDKAEDVEKVLKTSDEHRREAIEKAVEK